MYRTLVLACITGLVAICGSNAQTVTTQPLSGSTYCGGDPITVDYTVTGSFVPGNNFILQLSDANGSFQGGIYNLGSVASTSSGSISGTIPDNVTDGTKYRVRVIGSNPLVPGSDNGSDLSVGRKVDADISFYTTPAVVGMPVKTIEALSIWSGWSILWNFGDGATPATSTERRLESLTYSTPGTKHVTLTVTSPTGCSQVLTLDIEVSPASSVAIPASTVIVQDEQTFKGKDYNGKSFWVCPGGFVTLDMVDNARVFVEVGGRATLKSSDETIVYARTGASVSTESVSWSTVVYEAGAGVTKGVRTEIMQVPSITFDYSNAPAGGCPSLAPYTKKIPADAHTIAKKESSDASDAEFWVTGGELTSSGSGNTFSVENGSVIASGDNCVIYLKNGTSFDARGSHGHRIFYELGATIVDPGQDAAIFPSDNITFEVQGTSAVDAPSASTTGISIYPNPASADVSISVTGSDRIDAVTIRDLLGRQVRRIGATDGSTVGVDGLTAGVYYAEVRVGRTVRVEKFIVR